MRVLSLNELTTPAPEAGPRDWNAEGVVRLPQFYYQLGSRSALISKYRAAWDKAHWPEDAKWQSTQVNHDGWPHATPYVTVPEIRALVAPLAEHLEVLLGEPAGMHLNLTGWVSTERDWHQDGYLNPPHVGDYYAAVWIALDDIVRSSGPFQYVPGSHRWPQVTQSQIGEHVDLSDPRWPKQSEDILTLLFEEEIARREAKVETYIPQYGDVLIWHSRLLHRGSRAANFGGIRPAIIVHFSGIHHREDMPPAVQDEYGGWIFPLNGYQPVR